MTDILLIAGLWLDGSCWNRVVPDLEDRGHRAVPLFLPGQGAPPATATLEEQRAALTAVDASAGPVMVVGHSSAATLAWMAADDRPHKVASVVLIGGFPCGDGEAYADSFPVVDGMIPFPGWMAFESAVIADLDEEQRRVIAAQAIPVPEGVAKGVVKLGNERRYEVPVTVICPEFTVAQAREWVDGGEVPELARARQLDYVDIDSGHWPMLTRPSELADLLDCAAAG